MKIEKLATFLLVTVSIVTTSMIVITVKNGFNLKDANASPSSNILYVGGTGQDDYTKIQDAIDSAYDGDTIFVYSGTYYENVEINKSINLVGEDKDTAIIDANYSGDTIKINADHVNISNFSIIHSGDSYAGLKVTSSLNNTIYNCNISNNDYGIWLYQSNNNEISLCTFYLNNDDGIWLHQFSSDNIISNCTIYSNYNDGIYLCCGSIHNKIFHCTIYSNAGMGIRVGTSWDNTIYLNNFIDNNKQNAYEYKSNKWDNGNKGNYWSDFDERSEGASDTNSDGIVDSPYPIPGGGESIDRYPLMHPWEKIEEEKKGISGFEFVLLITIMVSMIMLKKRGREKNRDKTHTVIKVGKI